MEESTEDDHLSSTFSIQMTSADSNVFGKCAIQLNRQSSQPRILKAWMPELRVLLLSICLFAAIIITLGAYHGKPPPQYDYNVNINAIVAVLSTVLRATLLFVCE
ncbi:hypothetical protein BDP55DRAFT_105180 [Colletotrichum godetiae]|uniref:Uncharacterized protein n=1 Tax=Colletotrichum godetiae TaxID=1209918 RepID=A0AAJ0AM98_9PEZI|nr:uncharacterized protein BDP55DRAFT_105180 [Colletotrichum godetiae]KAK1676500.1 hypothetical protein BDP55DRAFT_105180 [Colletotrichum godetiae]